MSQLYGRKLTTVVQPHGYLSRPFNNVGACDDVAFVIDEESGAGPFADSPADLNDRLYLDDRRGGRSKDRLHQIFVIQGRELLPILAYGGE